MYKCNKMKTNYPSMFKNKFFLFLSVVFSLSIALVSCSDDDDKVGKPYFRIEDDPTGHSFDMNSSTVSFVVRSNRTWKVVPQEEGDWVTPSPINGKGSGPLEFTVEENESFDQRVMNFAFIVDGVEQSVLFRIEQEAGVPFLEVSDTEQGLSVFASGGEVEIDVAGNAPWTYSIDKDWLSEIEKTETKLSLVAEENNDAERKAIVTITSSLLPDFSAQVEITQSSGAAILEEDFNWLNYGSGKPYETANLKRYEYWTQEERDRGWYSSPNPFSKDEHLLYALVGYVKLGKTNYGGDLISPKLEGIEGTADVKVTFKSMGYLTAGAGTKDDNLLKVFALNDGEIEGQSEYIIDNFPNNRGDDEAGVINDAWAPEVAERSFIIRGATSETQIRFLGNAFDLRDNVPNKNRVFLDDIKVKIIQD